METALKIAKTGCDTLYVHIILFKKAYFTIYYFTHRNQQMLIENDVELQMPLCNLLACKNVVAPNNMQLFYFRPL